MLKADFTASEVDPPSNRWCASGHYAPETWERSGPNAVSEPVRFWSVSSVAYPEVNGVYCTICMTAANLMAADKRKTGKTLSFNKIE